MAHIENSSVDVIIWQIYMFNIDSFDRSINIGIDILFKHDKMRNEF